MEHWEKKPSRYFVLLLFAALFSLGAKAATAQSSWPRYKNPAKLNFRFPAQHPYVLLTPQMIEIARKRAATEPWAKQQMEGIIASANKDLSGEKPWDHLPPVGSGDHRIVARKLFAVGLAYSFSGDKRYARWVRDGLLTYAALYPTLPKHYGHRLTYDSLREAEWLLNIAPAYDMVASSGVFTPGQSRKVEDDLLKPAAACFMITDYKHDRRLRDLHFRCYNFQAWHVAVVGLAGLAAGDRNLAAWAINSPYGFRHLIAHDVNDDGMWWERSEGYHQFVVDAFIPLAEAMLHCGVDLYHMKVPTDRTSVEDARYPTDSSDRPKSLRMMFDPLFYITFPDLSYPAIGDSETGPLRADTSALIAYNRYHTPLLGWLVGRSSPDAQPPASDQDRHHQRPWEWLAYDFPHDAPASCPLRSGRFANTGEYRNGCSLFPSTGIVILREASGDYTEKPESTAVALNYGPHGGGHGHADNMELVLYSDGRQWIPDFGHMPYGTKWKGLWTSQTISANTIVVDGISQQPTGKKNPTWPTDNATHRVEGFLQRFNPGNKFASAYSDTDYAGIRLSRAVRLEGHSAVDDFTVADAKDADHQYDYVLHIDGELEKTSVPLEQASGALGKICGYQFVEQEKRGRANGPFTLTFASGRKRLRIWSPEKDPTEIIIASGLTNSPTRRMTMLILRRKAAQTRFVTVIEPVNPANAISSVQSNQSGLMIRFAHGTRRVPLQTQ